MSEASPSRFPHSWHAGDVIGTWKPGCPDCEVPTEELAKAWDDGHEQGFWNGRQSSGDPSQNALLGKDHAKATNPYRSYR